MVDNIPERHTFQTVEGFVSGPQLHQNLDHYFQSDLIVCNAACARL